MKGLILYVEDEVFLNQSKKERLEEEGYQIVWYTKGNKCIDDVKDGLKYDLAIVDLSLPDIGGDEVVGVLKETNPKTPVITISCYYRKPVDCDRHILKTITPGELVEEINSFLSGEFDF